MEKQAVAYIRVSTESQLEGYGLDAQEANIRKYAEANGYEIVEWFREEGVSGTIERRFAWGKLDIWMDDNPNVDTIIIPALDRLARDLMIQEAIIANLRKRDITLISVREPDLMADDPSRTLMRRVMGAFAEYEKDMINLRLKSGRIARANSGNRGAGQPPYGYSVAIGDNGKRTLVKVPEEIEVVKLVFELRQRGLSFQKIADHLNENGHKPRNWAEETPDVKFHNSTVQKILKNEIYFGKVTLHDDGELVASSSNDDFKIF